MGEERTSVLASWLDRTTFWLAVAAGTLLVAMVCLISTGVCARYFFGSPILGINEIVQLNAVALAMLALPYCTNAGAHVRADIFDGLIGRWGRLIGDLLTRVLSIVALSILVRRSWYKAADALEFGDATNMLGLPIWPFYGLIMVGMALCCLVFAVQILRLLTSGQEIDV